MNRMLVRGLGIISSVVYIFDLGIDEMGVFFMEKEIYENFRFGF